MNSKLFFTTIKNALPCLFFLSACSSKNIIGPAPVVASPKAKKPVAKKDPSAPKKGKAAKPVSATETEEIPFKEDAEAPNEGSDAAK